MHCEYNYTNQRGTTPNGWRGNFDSLPQIRGDHRFMTSSGDRGIRFYDDRGNLLFRTYYRPYGNEAW